MAPQVGFEPTTDRLTADSSTTELLWNNNSLATYYSHTDKVPTTIGAKELNFRVRYGNGCDLFAIATKHKRNVVPSKLDNKKVFHFLKRWLSPRSISISQLHMSPRFHL